MSDLAWFLDDAGRPRYVALSLAGERQTIIVEQAITDDAMNVLDPAVTRPETDAEYAARREAFIPKGATYFVAIDGDQPANVFDAETGALVSDLVTPWVQAGLKAR